MKTTAKHFEIFKKEAQRWINALGLKGWAIYYYHNDTIGDDCYAAHKYSLMGRWCAFTLNSEWGKHRPTTLELKRTAFHEVVEFMFARIRTIAKARYIGEDEIDEEIENLTLILENCFFGDRNERAKKLQKNTTGSTRRDKKSKATKTKNRGK